MNAVASQDVILITSMIINVILLVLVLRIPGIKQESFWDGFFVGAGEKNETEEERKEE